MQIILFYWICLNSKHDMLYCIELKEHSYIDVYSFVFFLLAIVNCVVCPSSICGFWLPLWCLQILLTFSFLPNSKLQPKIVTGRRCYNGIHNIKLQPYMVIKCSTNERNTILYKIWKIVIKYRHKMVRDGKLQYLIKCGFNFIYMT